jgi:hypothetical protein
MEKKPGARCTATPAHERKRGGQCHQHGKRLEGDAGEENNTAPPFRATLTLMRTGRAANSNGRRHRASGSIPPTIAKRRESCSSDGLGNVIPPTSADPMRPIQKELPVAERRFGVLINSHDDCLDVVVAPAFARS